jgi:hypothetical protein
LPATIEITEPKVQAVAAGHKQKFITNITKIILGKIIPVERLQLPQNIIERLCEYEMNIGFYNSHQINLKLGGCCLRMLTHYVLINE